MTRLLAVLIAVVAAIVGAYLLRKPSADPVVARATDEQAIRQTDIDWSKAAAAKDLERTVSYYAGDGSLLPPNAPIATGKEAIRGVWKTLMDSPGFAVSWQPTKVEVSRSGELGYATGTYELTVHGPKGQPATDRGKYVAVFKKQPDGSWKAVADMFNSDLPPPGA